MMKASICCCSWVGLLDRDSELGEVEMEIELEVALSAYALRNVSLEYVYSCRNEFQNKGLRSASGCHFR